MPIALRRLLAVVIAVLAIYLVGGNLFLNSQKARDLANRSPQRFTASWSRALTWFPGVVMLWDVKLHGQARTVKWEASGERVHGGINLIALAWRRVDSSWTHVSGMSASADVVGDDLLPPPYREDAWTLRFAAIDTSSLRQLRLGNTDIDAHGGGSVGFIKQLRGGPLEVLPSRLSLRDASVRHDGRLVLRDARIDLDFAIAKHWRDDAPGLRKLAISTGRLRVDGGLPLLGFKLDPAARRWQGLFGGKDGDATIEADVGLADAKLQDGSSVEVNATLNSSVSNQAFTDLATLRAELAGDDVVFALHLPPPPQGSGSADGEWRIADARLSAPKSWPELLARSSGRLDMDWRFDALDWLEPLLVESRWLQLRGAGDITAKLRMQHGVLTTGSQVDIPGVELGVVVADHRFHGNATANARVIATGDATPGRLEIAAALDTFDVAAAAAPDASLVRGKDLRIAMNASSDLARLRETTQARLQFKQAEMPDVRAFNRYLPTDSVVLLGGSNRLDGDVRIDAAGKVASADVAMAGSQVRARLGAIDLSGNFALDAKLVASTPRPGLYELDGSRLSVDRLRVGDVDGRNSKPTWATLALSRGSVQPGQPWTVDADADIRMENIRLLLGLFSRERAFPKWVVRLADAGVLQATGLMRSEGDTLVFDRVVASNDRFDAAARMRVRRGRPSGDLLLRWHALSLGLEVDGDERHFKLVRARHWYESRPDFLPPQATGRPAVAPKPR